MGGGAEHFGCEENTIVNRPHPITQHTPLPPTNTLPQHRLALSSVSLVIDTGLEWEIETGGDGVGGGDLGLGGSGGGLGMGVWELVLLILLILLILSKIL